MNEINYYSISSKEILDTTLPIDSPFDPSDIGTIYLLNPYSIMICLAQSTQLVTSFCIVSSIYFAIRGKLNASSLFLAFGAYLTMYPILLIPPAILLISEHGQIPVIFS